MSDDREQLLILAELLVAENSSFLAELLVAENSFSSKQNYWWQRTVSYLSGITGCREQFTYLSRITGGKEQVLILAE
jgi:hypothetical protein